jgi:hypothetical protein
MKKPFSAFSIVLLFFAPSLFGQGYQPGTVLLANGDTVSGLIRYNDWKYTPSRILFRKDNESALQIYRPSDLKGFTINDKSYLSAVVEVDFRYDDLQRMTTDEVIRTTADTVFLKREVAGSKPLYSFKDHVYHFYIPRNDTLELLRFKKYKSWATSEVAYRGHGRVVRMQNNYLYQLQDYLDGCNAAKPVIIATEYSLNGMIATFNAYYECMGVNPPSAAIPEKEKPAIAVRAGVNLQNLTGKDADGNKFDNKFKTGFNVGFTADFQIMRKLYFQLAALYTTKGAIVNEGGDVTATLGYLELPLHFLVKPQIGERRAIIGFGPYVAFGLSGKAEGDNYPEKAVDFDDEVMAEGYYSNPFTVKKMDVGVNLFCGYEFTKRFSAQLNGQLGLTNLQPIVIGIVGGLGKLRNTGAGISLSYRM